jgi:hypothetical protein
VPWVHAPPEGGVALGDTTLLPFVPALTGRRTVVGHGLETPDYVARVTSVAISTIAIASGRGGADEASAIGADYLVFSQPPESATRAQRDLVSGLRTTVDRIGPLRLVFANDGARVFAVDREALERR